MTQGYLSIVLHAHLPYVRHPEHPRFLEEDWLFEAMTETYIPLIEMFASLERDRVPFRITMSLTPTLLSMMQDPLLQAKYIHHLDRLIELSQKEIDRTQYDPHLNYLAKMYHQIFCRTKSIFCDQYHCDLTKAFKEYSQKQYLEIITCGATHGFLPLSELYPEAIRAQIQTAVATHERVLGVKPKGIWLPECGFYPGVDVFLKEAGIRYFVLDTHGILFGTPRPKYGVFAPVYCRSGVAAFGRDVESSKSVWSSKEGYPGDARYREFYRDIGFDLDYEYVRPYMNGDGTRVNTGIKYFKITGQSDNKELYRPDDARQAVHEHSANFMFNRQKQAEYLYEIMGKEPIIVSPYDAELFGHWWFEGPKWIESLFRKIHFDQGTLALITPSEYLDKFPKNQVIEPSASSWGYNGYSEVWLNDSNHWIYRHLHQAFERMIGCATKHRDESRPEFIRALQQMSREVLLAQSSDWAFILKTGTHTSYAIKRTKNHLERFTKLWEFFEKNSVDMAYLESLESMDNIFPNIDYKVYAKN